MRTDAQRTEVMGMALGLRDRARDICCTGIHQGDWMRFFDHLEITWCDLNNQSSPMHCPEAGASLAPMSLEPWGRNWARARQDDTVENLMNHQRQHLEFPAFKVLLDPRSRRSDGSDLPNTEAHKHVLAHEFGHACSAVQRFMDAKYGTGRGEESDRQAALHYVRYYSGGPSCGLDSSIGLPVYGALFGRLGLDDSVVECMASLTQSFQRSRFPAHWGRLGEHRETPQRRNCAPICPINQFEEFFADAYSLMMTQTPEELGIRTDFMCTSQRDVQHPMGSDTWRCLARSLRFCEHIATVMACQR